MSAQKHTQEDVRALASEPRQRNPKYHKPWCGHAGDQTVPVAAARLRRDLRPAKCCHTGDDLQEEYRY